MKKPFYKRWWVWVIGIVIILAVIGNMGDDTELVGKDAQTASTTEQIYNVGDQVKLGDYILTVTSVDKSTGNDFDKPKAGHEYVIVNVKIENNGNKIVDYNPFDFKSSNSNGQIQSPALTAVDNDTALSSGELAPSGSVTGTIVFEHPADDPDLKLIYQPSFWSDKIIMVQLK